MKLKVVISESAKKEFLHLMPEIQKRLKKAFDELSDNPYENRSDADIKKLRGAYKPPFYRIRIGDYRIIYAVVENEIRITSIIHRKKGYKWLE
ncbi:type II toxin-antitoxin system RelE/ParE family toxin [Candidatus Micrarchaeota archaeon]|nr:type II toxin-antitoxin system RelE/ParE family toxin [Candidatus Micrarchaeota archaeon]MBU1166013.1 type II toxin-antitoxin system RelE/ParE family toxin [Candidatus Micrarchaeota archaeon]MBU1886933.1 type II toxin-antitoxin system RelE/ParE family toxin [Candidatus Micrarchaeota archaeon]